MKKKINKIYKKIKAIKKEYNLFLPYNTTDTIQDKLDQTYEWIDITYEYIEKEVLDLGYDMLDDFLVSFDWYWHVNNAIPDQEYYLKRLYLTINYLTDEVVPKLEKIKQLENS